MSGASRSAGGFIVKKQVSPWLALFSRRWLLKTLLVIVAMSGLARLGFWQLDRLDQRRGFNERVSAQINQPPMVLTSNLLNQNLKNMEYRKVVVVGEYDHPQQVALRNQVNGNQWGVHLLTPLIIEGAEQAILVDRGWIPAEDFLSGDWDKYGEPGMVTIHGILRRSQVEPDFGKRSDPIPVPGGERILAWNFPNLSAIAQQMPYPLVDVYIQVSPDPSWQGLPARFTPELDLSEGPHLGYAIQWFTFSLIAGIGYLLFVNKKTQA